jgi:hypothetical protein
MNDFRNLGNANAALAALNFNQHDRFADEFLHRLFRLVGEDAPEALVDGYFNEARAMEMLDAMLEELPLPNDNLPPPAELDEFFHLLANSIQAVKVEDGIAHSLVRQLQQENAGRRRQRTPSPPIVISGDTPISISDDDPDNDFYGDVAEEETLLAARSDSDSDSDESPRDPDDFIDDEAEEVPEGEESSPAASDESSSEDSEDETEEDEEDGLDVGDPPSLPVLSLVDYGSDDSSDS